MVMDVDTYHRMRGMSETSREKPGVRTDGVRLFYRLNTKELENSQFEKKISKRH